MTFKPEEIGAFVAGAISFVSTALAIWSRLKKNFPQTDGDPEREKTIFDIAVDLKEENTKLGKKIDRFEQDCNDRILAIERDKNARIDAQADYIRQLLAKLDQFTK